MSDKSATCEWRLDDEYGFQLAFFRENLWSPSSEESYVSVPPFKVPANEPDIDNIVLYQFLNRGFLPKVKAQSKHQKLYLKLFKFSKDIPRGESYEKILKKFSLTAIADRQDYKNYIGNDDNIFVKFGWIDLESNDFASRPFPKFLIPKDPKIEQDKFDSSLPFSSLYLLPTQEAEPGLSEEQLIEHSRKGVSTFQKKLFDIYSSNDFIKIETDELHSSMFVKKTNKSKQISVIWLKQLEFFQDVRKRPMPLDRDRHFLSSLLLVHYTDFISDEERDLPNDKEDLASNWRPGLDSHHILEIASVVRLEKKSRRKKVKK